MILMFACVVLSMFFKTNNEESFNVSKQKQKSESDYIYSGNYFLFGISTRIQGKTVEGTMKYLSPTILRFENLLHDIKTNYIFEGSEEKGGSYTDAKNPKKSIRYNKEKKLFTVINGVDSADYSVITVEKHIPQDEI